MQMPPPVVSSQLLFFALHFCPRAPEPVDQRSEIAATIVIDFPQFDETLSLCAVSEALVSLRFMPFLCHFLFSAPFAFPAQFRTVYVYVQAC